MTHENEFFVTHINYDAMLSLQYAIIEWNRLDPETVQAEYKMEYDEIHFDYITKRIIPYAYTITTWGDVKW